MSKIRSHMNMFKKIKLTHHCLNLHRPFVAAESTAWISFIFVLVRFTSDQLASSPPFPLPGDASPMSNVNLPCHITLPSHRVKMNSLPPLHLPTTLHHAASPLELKLKHWIHTTTIGHPLRTTRLSPSSAIKKSSKPSPLSPALNRVSILPPN
jgi:hypothetical protein